MFFERGVHRLKVFVLRTSPLRMGLCLGILHMGLAFMEYLRGLCFTADIGRGNWDWFWQTINISDLLEHPLQSFWYLHAQPPGFSLWGWLWLRLGEAANFPSSLQWGYIVMGAAVTTLTYLLVHSFLRHRLMAFAAGALMAFNPSLLLYESYIIYEPIVIFLLTFSTWALWKALRTLKARWLVLFIVSLNLLVMTRSMYHLVYLAGALAFALPLWRRITAGRALTLLALALALPLAWYAKNLHQYGFFGASSWCGMGFYRCVTQDYSYEEQKGLAKKGLIPDFALKYYAFEHAPHVYRAYGFDRESDIPLLWRDDFHNINMPEISRAYGEAAIRLIQLNPRRYLRSIHDSYRKYCRPPSRYLHLEPLRAHYVLWEPIYSQFLYGQWIMDAIEIVSYINYGSLYYIVFPLMMIVGLAWLVKIGLDCLRRRRMRGHAGRGRLARYWLVAFVWYTLAYVTLVGCLFENGENERFRFATEPLALFLGIVLIQSIRNRPLGRFSLVKGRING